MIWKYNRCKIYLSSLKYFSYEYLFLTTHFFNVFLFISFINRISTIKIKLSTIIYQLPPIDKIVKRGL